MGQKGGGAKGEPRTVCTYLVFISRTVQCACVTSNVLKRALASINRTWAGAARSRPRYYCRQVLGLDLHDGRLFAGSPATGHRAWYCSLRVRLQTSSVSVRVSRSLVVVWRRHIPTSIGLPRILQSVSSAPVSQLLGIRRRGRVGVEFVRQNRSVVRCTSDSIPITRRERPGLGIRVHTRIPVRR